MGDQQVAVGKLDWVQQQAQLDSNTHPESLGASLQGQSVVYVGVQGRGVVGALGFAGDQMLRAYDASFYSIQLVMVPAHRLHTLSTFRPALVTARDRLAVASRL